LGWELVGVVDKRFKGGLLAGLVINIGGSIQNELVLKDRLLRFP
jgi:hypothetical protein